MSWHRDGVWNSTCTVFVLLELSIEFIRNRCEFMVGLVLEEIGLLDLDDLIPIADSDGSTQKAAFLRAGWGHRYSNAKRNH